MHPARPVHDRGLRARPHAGRPDVVRRVVGDRPPFLGVGEDRRAEASHTAATERLVQRLVQRAKAAPVELGQRPADFGERVAELVPTVRQRHGVRRARLLLHEILDCERPNATAAVALERQVARHIRDARHERADQRPITQRLRAPPVEVPDRRDRRPAVDRVQVQVRVQHPRAVLRVRRQPDSQAEPDAAVPLARPVGRRERRQGRRGLDDARGAARVVHVVAPDHAGLVPDALRTLRPGGEEQAGVLDPAAGEDHDRRPDPGSPAVHGLHGQPFHAARLVQADLGDVGVQQGRDVGRAGDVPPVVRPEVQGVARPEERLRFEPVRGEHRTLSARRAGRVEPGQIRDPQQAACAPVEGKQLRTAHRPPGVREPVARDEVVLVEERDLPPPRVGGAAEAPFPRGRRHRHVRGLELVQRLGSGVGLEPARLDDEHAPARALQLGGAGHACSARPDDADVGLEDCSVLLDARVAEHGLSPAAARDPGGRSEPGAEQ